MQIWGLNENHVGYVLKGFFKRYFKYDNKKKASLQILIY